VDAPNVLVPADVKVFGEQDKVESDEVTSTARGWWRTNADRTTAVGLEKSLEMLRDLLRESRFDVSGYMLREGVLILKSCVGRFWIQVGDGRCAVRGSWIFLMDHSQGAAMAALLVALVSVCYAVRVMTVGNLRVVEQLERPHTYPEFLINGEVPHPPL
jgi:hypothetical protein